MARIYQYFAVHYIRTKWREMWIDLCCIAYSCVWTRGAPYIMTYLQTGESEPRQYTVHCAGSFEDLLQHSSQRKVQAGARYIWTWPQLNSTDLDAEVFNAVFIKRKAQIHKVWLNRFWIFWKSDIIYEATATNNIFCFSENVVWHRVTKQQSNIESCNWKFWKKQVSQLTRTLKFYKQLVYIVPLGWSTEKGIGDYGVRLYSSLCIGGKLVQLKSWATVGGRRRLGQGTYVL
jgi:hypothetical protein